MTLLPGTLFLIDTSAMARLSHPAVRKTIADMINAGLAATCITVELEAGYSSRNAQEMQQIFAVREQHFHHLVVNEKVNVDARRIMHRMAAQGLHRAAGAMDILTAAIAHVHRAIVLHYDADFDHIASVTGQQTRWVVPRGSID